MPDTLQIECACIPANPFYVRWLNRYAGYDYQMFQKRQLYEYKQENLITYEPFISDFQTATGTGKLISKIVEHSVVIGVERLNNTDWDILSHILNSPVVQHYDMRLQQWVDVVIDSAKCVRQTDESAHTVELTLILPKPQLAI
ncbi:MAG: hypothetical protein LBP85_07180 [Prevotellaceae bacterium]|nr:hypothetical protein [Prevotellaceae bacterium]